MVNGPPCAVCGFTLRWLPQQNGWGCDRCQRMFPASGPGAPQQPQQAAPPAWSSPAQQPYQQQGFGRPQQPPQGYPPQQPAYGQQPPNPYAPQQPAYGQQPPYSPHAAHPPQPVAPVATSGGKKGGKGLLIGGAIAAVAIAGGVIAFVMLKGGGGTKGGDGRSAVIKSTLAAMGAGDVDQLMRLSDVEGFYGKVIDCSGKTPPRDKEAADEEAESAEQQENKDPKKYAEKRKKELAEKIVPLAKGAKIELVEITSKDPPAPKDRPKGDDAAKEAGSDNEEHGVAIPVGTRMYKGCYTKVPMRFHIAKIKVKVTPPGEKAAIEQDSEVGLMQIGNGFWLGSPPPLNLGTLALEKELTAVQEKVCACTKAECAQKLKDEFKDSPRSKEIKKQIRDLAEKDKERIDKIEEAIEACERKLEGGEQLAAMAQFKDQVCKCNDQACVDKVVQEMSVYGKSHGSDRLSEDDTKKVSAIAEQMGQCMAKVAEAERMRNPPPPDPTLGGGIGATIAESTGGGIPPKCKEYIEVLEKLTSCPGFPESSKKDIETSIKAFAEAWKDYDRLPAASRKSIDDACEQGADAMRQSLKAMKC